MIEVLKAGLFTTIQDRGRHGYSAFGVPTSGTMDNYSAQFANMLVGNNANDAVIEATLIGPKLLFASDTIICVSGADMSPMLNEHTILMNQAMAVKQNDVLSFGSLKSGYRAYIAVYGGFQTEKIMKSRSMYPNITSKHNIEVGDKLKTITNTISAQKANASVKFNMALFSTKEILTFKGPEFDLLPEDIQKRLESDSFTISKNNNRMGYQIEERLANKLPAILTGPVLPGTVQLTPSGKLIVLMKDGQTTGGYPRVLQLKEEAINILAQKKVGDSIQFMLV